MSEAEQDRIEIPDTRCSNNTNEGTADGSNTSLLETIEVLESSDPLVAEEEMVDLTYQVFTSFVDLTNNNDSIVVSPKRRRDWESYVLSSDEEEAAVIVPDSPATAPLSTAPEPISNARSTPKTISCPICMDTFGEIIDGGRTLVSSQCGHLFCNTCIHDSLAKSQTCPTCRKKLNHQQYHQIYI
uniref:E3 ubiquitin-protein ligase RNF4-like n=1 Tax=Salmo trutta TaxID=8032 RepID=A0A674E599_SALTR